MGKEKFPKPSDIPWDKVQQIRVSSDKSTYSFEFDLHGRRQKMTFTISPDSTAVTLSSENGDPIVHAAQKGQELRILDFSERLALSKKAKMHKLLRSRPSKPSS
jgi:hypothetical protein